jgi:hypothetical protein
MSLSKQWPEPFLVRCIRGCVDDGETSSNPPGASELVVKGSWELVLPSSKGSDFPLVELTQSRFVLVRNQSALKSGQKSSTYSERASSPSLSLEVIVEADERTVAAE